MKTQKAEGEEKEARTKSNALYEEVMAEVFALAPTRTSRWYEVLGDAVRKVHGVSAKVLENSMLPWKDSLTSVHALQLVTVRLTGNLKRMQRGLPVSPCVAAGDLEERAWLRVVRRYAADAPERPKQLDYLIMTGTFAGQIVQGHVRHTSANLLRAIDPKRNSLRRLDDLLGVELQYMLRLRDGQVTVQDMVKPTAGDLTRYRGQQLYRYDRRRALREAESREKPLRNCRVAPSCLLCGRGQLSRDMDWPCSRAMRTYAEEEVHEAQRG